jgi:hypothetical protein
VVCKGHVLGHNFYGLRFSTVGVNDPCGSTGDMELYEDDVDLKKIGSSLAPPLSTTSLARH